MRKVSYDSCMDKLRQKSLAVYTRATSLNYTPSRSRRPRDPEEDYILFLLDRRRRQHALTSGRIEKLGPRRYRWNE
ncbi:hypothetical protein [Desulfoscipio geothermicus]|uniref:Uncharacterized protein n=1 Tax=Desulfoscipio geothermicus DSM 3669 TaxID=1121426 RepID=A0A1I6DEC9_9FIRM|nr:hypothetical protein [Desulfoscipio geothermicus]SFR03662.1 hypothetical protein SAMN05660706_10971 [Desulfoscipio geothermicus DSM 3669]